MLNISHISKSFNPGTPNEKLVLNDLSLNVEKGDFITIIFHIRMGILHLSHL